MPVPLTFQAFLLDALILSDDVYIYYEYSEEKGMIKAKKGLGMPFPQCIRFSYSFSDLVGWTDRGAWFSPDGPAGSRSLVYRKNTYNNLSQLAKIQLEDMAPPLYFYDANGVMITCDGKSANYKYASTGQLK